MWRYNNNNKNNSTIELRWMPLHYYFCIIFLCLIATVNSGPIETRQRRMIAEQTNNTKILDTSCFMDGNHVSKKSIICEKKSGCRAIQKTGECCPEYQCECEKNGTIYGNGEKLISPTDPCRVCYCQGGEILCNPVTCYIRNDCEPKYIQGRCCPEYDNCPTLEQLLASQSSKETDITNEVKDVTKQIVEVTTSSTTTKTTTTVEEKTTPSPDNPLGIKIKEITKPEEIRITNEKPKIHPKLKFSTATQTTRTQTTQQIEIEVTSMKTNIDESNDSNNDSNDITYKHDKTNQSAFVEDLHKLDNNELLGIGDHRTDNFKNVRHATNHFDDTITFNDDSSNSSQPESVDRSTSSPIDISSSTPTLNLIKNQLAPSVLHIGDKVLILDHNENTRPLTVNVEGLQRGEEPDDNTEDYETRSEKNLTSNHDELELIPSITKDLIDETSIIYNNETDYTNSTMLMNDDETEGARHMNNTELSNKDFDTFGEEKNSTHMNDDLDLTLQFDQYQNITDFFNDTQIETSSTAAENQYEEDHVASSSDNIQVLSTSPFEELSSSRIPLSENDTTSDTSEYPMGSSTTESFKPEHTSEEPQSTSQKTYVEDDETPNHELINPGHARIPEDVSIFGRDQELVSDAEEEKDKTVLTKVKYEMPSKILSEVTIYRSNVTIKDKNSVDDKEQLLSTMSPEWLKKESHSTEVPHSSNLKSEELLEVNTTNNAHFRSEESSLLSSSVPLNSSTTETTTTERNSNETDITTKSSHIIHNVSMHLGSEENEDDGSGGGSGNGNISSGNEGGDKLKINPLVRIYESVESSGSDLDIDSLIIDDFHTTNNGS